jgi:hypothetical protein
VVPSRVREHGLQPLLVAIVDRLIHTLHVLALRLHQPFEILAGRDHHTARSALEVRTEAAVEFHESGGDVMKSIDTDIRIFK